MTFTRVGAGILVLLAGGCSADLAMFKADWNWWSKSDTPQVQVYGAEAYVGPDGACAATATGEGVRGVSLGMTECQLVQLAGPTSQIDIGTNERGERTVVITYPEGERAGIYRFTSGALTSVEGVPPPPKPAKPPPRKRKPKAAPAPS